MASTLSAFMAQNAAKVDNRKIVASRRFTDEKGKPLAWEICCITAGENQKIRRSCEKRVPVPGGKRGQYTMDFDTAGYQSKIAARCTVFPNLNDAELQESYGVMSAEQLITAMLISGEYDDYVAAILEHNGFSVDEAVDEAKN